MKSDNEYRKDFNLLLGKWLFFFFRISELFTNGLTPVPRLGQEPCGPHSANQITDHVTGPFSRDLACTSLPAFSKVQKRSYFGSAHPTAL